MKLLINNIKFLNVHSLYSCPNDALEYELYMRVIDSKEYIYIMAHLFPFSMYGYLESEKNTFHDKEHMDMI